MTKQQICSWKETLALWLEMLILETADGAGIQVQQKQNFDNNLSSSNAAFL